MVAEYKSIMKNDVWEVVPKPEGKSIVTSRWIYKIKHVANGSIQKYKARFLVVVSHRKKAYTIMRHSLQWLGTPLFES